MAAELSEITDVQAVLRHWENHYMIPGYDPIPVLTRLSEIMECETENYYKKDPDPFDDRHPIRSDPECELGRMLKILFREDNFVTKLVNDYLRDSYYSRQQIIRDVAPLNVAACRLMWVILPGLEISAVFQVESDMENLMLRLFNWAEKSYEPLQSYATGLLAAAMDVQEIASGYRERNGKLLPLLLQRLHSMNVPKEKDEFQRPFAHLSNESEATLKNEEGEKDVRGDQDVNPDTCNTAKKKARFRSDDDHDSEIPAKQIRMDVSDVAQEQLVLDESNDSKPMCSTSDSPDIIVLSDSDTKSSNTVQNATKPPESYISSPLHYISHDEYSNSDSTTNMRARISIYPPTDESKQMLILRYLTSMGEYQEFMGQVFEQKALELILHYINVRETRYQRIAFEALKYLAALLYHKKFSIEFLLMGGLLRLIEVPRPGIASTGVSICLCHIAYSEDTMERVCMMPQYVITDLVRYGLWLLQSPHESGVNNAVIFFSYSFQFKVILSEFDNQDGLRKLYNVISVLPILVNEDDNQMTDDQEYAARQAVRHVCVALKRYLEAHLYHKYVQVMRQYHPDTAPAALPPYKACRSTPEEVSVRVRTLQELLFFKSPWPPIDELMRLGGITLLLLVIAFAYEWNYSGRAETVRSALDVIAIGCVLPKVQALLCEKLDLPEESLTVGTSIVLGAAEREIVADADVQKSALAVLVNCVCAPTNRNATNIIRFSSPVTPNARKKMPSKSSEELIHKVWESVRANNGILILLQLMMVKTPITDADSIRALACQALAGLARSDKIRQIISKLPLFTNGQLQILMKDPILQEKRQEHVSFQKHALELMERVSGKSNSGEFFSSLANIHKANIVAQTRIQFNDKQLFQLIHQHLLDRGMTEAATALRREANLNLTVPSRPMHSQLATLYRSPANASIQMRNRASTQRSTNTPGTSQNTPTRLINFLNHEAGRSGETASENFMTPIRVRKPSIPHTFLDKISNQSGTNQRSLEKQISCTEIGSHFNPVNRNIVNPVRTVTLDSIVTEYLYNQHALCKNPMATCPQFDLLVPHKCPDPRPFKITSQCTNFAGRFTRRPLGYNFKKLDRKFTHSQFCPVKTFRPPDNESFFTCCAFAHNHQNIVVGTYSGEIRIFNTATGLELTSSQSHESYVFNVQTNKECSLLLSSCTWRRPLSAVSLITNNGLVTKFSLQDEEYIEFGNMQDRIVGTKGSVATIYDVGTGQEVVEFVPIISNSYKHNRATFCPNDDLVLSDGVLWDVNSGKSIHKFDKFNQNLSGVFHPNGIEVVSNTEIWDLRTYNLLRTVPALDQSHITFSSSNTIYTISLEKESDTTLEHYESSFKTLDATDYSNISTIDVRRSIYYLCVNKWDSQIALVENQGLYDSVQESAVRLYDVGRKRDQDDDEAEEDDDSDIDGSDNGSLSSDVESEDEVENVAAAILDEARDIDLNEMLERRNRRNRNNRMNNINNDNESDSDPSFNLTDDDISEASEMSALSHILFDDP